MAQKIARRLTKRMEQLKNAVADFDMEARYKEAEVNDILRVHFEDHVFARRLMIQ